MRRVGETFNALALGLERTQAGGSSVRGKWGASFCFIIEPSAFVAEAGVVLGVRLSLAQAVAHKIRFEDLREHRGRRFPGLHMLPAPRSTDLAAQRAVSESGVTTSTTKRQPCLARGIGLVLNFEKELTGVADLRREAKPLETRGNR
jgi:hypothetical protein